MELFVVEQNHPMPKVKEKSSIGVGDNRHVSLSLDRLLCTLGQMNLPWLPGPPWCKALRSVERFVRVK